MRTKSYALLILIALFLLFLYASMFTVVEGQKAIVLKLGEIVLNKKTGKPEELDPGLHFKTPFITHARDFSVMLQTMNVDSSRILTAEQKYVMVSYYAKWRIEDLPLFYTRTGGYTVRADQLLEQKINGALRAAFGTRKIQEVISEDRVDLMQNLKAQAEKSANSLGIDVVDVRIVGIDLPPNVQESVFQRMRTKREQVATKLRAEGRAEQDEIMAKADRQVVVDLAQAKAKAQQVRANGDATAGKIYSDAYTQDPSFYAMYRSLEAYRNVFKKDTVMVLQPKGQFFQYFNFNGKHKS